MVVSLFVCIVVVCFFKEGFLEIPSHTTLFFFVGSMYVERLHYNSVCVSVCI